MTVVHGRQGKRRMEPVVRDCSRKEMSSEEGRGRIVVTVIRDWSAREERCQPGKGWPLLC